MFTRRQALVVGLCLQGTSLHAAAPLPMPQEFLQETPHLYRATHGLPDGPIQLLDFTPDGQPLAFAAGQWLALEDTQWRGLTQLTSAPPTSFSCLDPAGNPVSVPLPGAEVRQVLRSQTAVWVVSATAIVAVRPGSMESIDVPPGQPIHQLALSHGEGPTLYAATRGGLFERSKEAWRRVEVPDGLGRVWATEEVLGVAVDDQRQLWFATRAGVGCRTRQGWRFFEGKDGLPYNDFTGLAAGPNGALWLATRLGVIRFDAAGWHYRQGPRWLPHDDVRQVHVDRHGSAWFATASGVGQIAFAPTTLARKAAFYEAEIAQYIQRTPFGYTAEAPLRRPADKSSAAPQDSDNDGLWTAMYGAGECFAYAATRDAEAQRRARRAFDALRFLQKVTQGGTSSPPKGFVARTILPTSGPDPNEGRLEHDREAQKRDALWKIYSPRWPRSADGQWFWKSDTSSDELDGHYFFYPLYYDFCAETPEEKNRVREVVRDLTDHLLDHGFVLIDHDGQPTRWGIFGPQSLNRDPNWWPERGLNSLSLLAYLAAASHVVGDPKYGAAARELIDHHGYAHNAMYPKVQHGPGSGNQSDDEMAFMCYYTLLRCSSDEPLKAQIRYSLHRYWANESAEMNPFFHFVAAAHNSGQTVANPWGRFPLEPWHGWLEDSLATLRGFPLDRLNWPHRNRHRLDLRPLEPVASTDLYEPARGRRGYRVNGKVLPVENRHFGHWNTDPWQLDYGGAGDELASGTVFLLPYYLGLHHGFIAKP